MLPSLIALIIWIDAETNVRAAKTKHATERATYFSRARARRVDTGMETVYLLVPKVHKGGYVSFFISERKRSEQALILVVQEAFINGVAWPRPWR